MQVDVQPINCTRCLAPNTSVEFAPDTIGIAKLGVHTTVAGFYMVTIACNLTKVRVKTRWQAHAARLSPVSNC
jgi:hypothetical protein